MSLKPRNRPKICFKCYTRFYTIEGDQCGVCGRQTCPHCRQCACSNINKNKMTIQARFKHISLKDIERVGEKKDLEITGVLSPLIGQELVKINNNKVLLSHFRISEGKSYYQLLIWGVLPHEIYEHRYQPLKVTLSGVRKEFFNNKLQLVLQKRSIIKINDNQQFKQAHISFEDQTIKMTI